MCFGCSKGRPIETVHLSTHNICFGLEIRKRMFDYALLSGGLTLARTSHRKYFPRHRKYFLSYSFQEEYEKLRSPLYKESDVIIICYSETDRCSYENISEFWIPEMTKCTSHRPPLVLVGNFYDVNGNQSSSDQSETVISAKEGTILKKEIDADIFVRCHIQNTKDVHKVFLEAAISAVTKKRRRNSLIQRIWGRSKSFSHAITS